MFSGNVGCRSGRRLMDSGASIRKDAICGRVDNTV